MNLTGDDDDDPVRFELHFSPPDDDVPVNMQKIPDQPTVQMWYHENRLYEQTNEAGALLTIYDIKSRALKTYRPDPGLQSYHINLPPGAYIARLDGNNTYETMKIITAQAPKYRRTVVRLYGYTTLQTHGRASL